MFKDKIVERVRKNREEIFSNFNYDLKKYSEYILESQKGQKRKLISLEELKNKISPH